MVMIANFRKKLMDNILCYCNRLFVFFAQLSFRRVISLNTGVIYLIHFIVKRILKLCYMLYVLTSVCLSVFFLFTVFLLVSMGHMLPEINLIDLIMNNKFQLTVMSELDKLMR